MARRQVVEVQCDRCSRIEHAPENQLARKITIEVTGQEPVVFEDLCTPCWKTVNNHLEQACKKIEGVSPDRKANEENIKKFLEEQQKNPPTHKKDPMAPTLDAGGTTRG